MTTACAKCRRETTDQLRRGLCANCYQSARRRVGFESKYVDAAPVREHVRHLVAAGISQRQVARIANVRWDDMTTLMTGRGDRGPDRRIFRDKAARILAIRIPDVVSHRDVAAGRRVDSTGTVRRLRALVAIGYPQAAVCRRLGLLPTNGSQLFTGKRPYVLAATARRVENLFNELQLTIGPSADARYRAQQLGWLPPLAWDEDTIDDPAAEPAPAADKPTRGLDRYAEMRDLGYSDALIVQRLNISARSLERALERAGLPVRPELRQLAREVRNNQEAQRSA